MRTIIILLLLISSVCAACFPSTGRTETCRMATPDEVAALFDRWNAALLTRDAKIVASLYAERSLLLPTVSNKPRFTTAEKEDYFRHFLEKGPSGKVDRRFIDTGCNTALDTGLYTFTFADTGERIAARYTFTYRWNGSAWLITSHHSSAMPEGVSHSGR